MSILINGLEMPQNCADCKLRIAVECCGNLPHNTRMPNCPVVPVPPYSRLIDAFDTVKTLCDKGLYMHAEIVSDMPTIICGERVKT